MSIAGKIDDALAVPMAANNIAEWWDTIAPTDLATYVVSGADLVSLLPDALIIPPIPPAVIRMGVLPFLRGILRGGNRKIELYAKILVHLADPQHYGGRFQGHCLVMSWGQYPPGSPMVQMILARFPGLSAVSSVWPWYVANMDRVVARLIRQLEGGVVANDRRPADSDGDILGGLDPGGLDDGGDRHLEAGVVNDDMAFAVSNIGFGGGFDAD